MHPETVNPELFRWNRRRFAREMREDSVAVFCSHDTVSSDGDAHRRYRQNPDLYYLTGVEQPDTVLVLAPGTAKQGFAEVLFVRRPDHRAARRRGPALDTRAAAQVSGVAQVCYLDELDAILHELILLASRVYVNAREDRHAYSEAPARDLRFAERLMRMYPAHKYHRAQPILKQIGMVKSAPEVGLISKAIALADAGLRAGAEAIAPDTPEHTVEAAALATVVAGGAQGLAHPVRVASGPRALYPDYDANDRACEPGALVQVQVGVRYAGYHASVARVFPVDGHFDPEQLALYAELEALLTAGVESLVPGRTLPEVAAELSDASREAAERLGVVHPRADVHYPAELFGHVGRNLRDPYQPYAPLQSGMVIACAPALYLPERGLGAQLRNVVLVTDEGPVDLTARLPTTVTAVEQTLGMLV